jgi:hypothetical protein
MKSKENLSLPCRYIKNLSVSCVINWIKAKRCSKTCHDVSIGPTKSLLNHTIYVEDANTLSIVSPD